MVGGFSGLLNLEGFMITPLSVNLHVCTCVFVFACVCMCVCGSGGLNYITVKTHHIDLTTVCLLL